MMRLPHTATQEDRMAFAARYFDGIAAVLRAFDVEAVARMLALLESAWLREAQVFLAGNGGSAATASHMANDLRKSCHARGPGTGGFRAIALTDNVPLMTAWANDVGYDEIFAAQLAPLARPDDVLVLISASGNSANLLRAAEVARQRGLKLVALLGRDGGELKARVDVAVTVPAQEYGPIEDAHLMVNHLVASYFAAYPRPPAR